MRLFIEFLLSKFAYSIVVIELDSNETKKTSVYIYLSFLSMNSIIPIYVILKCY